MDAWTLGRGSEKEFFERGRKIAKLADQGLPIPSALLSTSEEPEQDYLVDYLCFPCEAGTLIVCKTVGTPRPILPYKYIAIGFY